MELTMINRKGFKGRFYDSIIKGMETAFGNLYPNNKVSIKYGSSQECYSFSVYINGETFQKGDFPMVKDTLIYIDDFSNLAAIPLFSDIPKDEYIKEYMDYSADNYKMIEDEWKKFKEEYEPQGVIFTDMSLTKSRFRISFYHPELSPKKTNNERKYDQYGRRDPNVPEMVPSEWYDGQYFNVQPISTNTAKTIISRTRGALKRLMKGEQK